MKGNCNYLMNNVYIYNNDFNSLLNLINILIKNNIKPNDIKSKEYQANIFDNIIELKLDNKDITKEYKKNINQADFKMIYYTFLSNFKNRELLIFYYILNYFKYGDNTKYMRNLNCVCEVLKMSKYVSRESHKFKGFIRFKELQNNILYAEIEPENNILSLLSNHFKNRLKNECWIIKDKKRRIISLYDKCKLYIVREEILKLKEVNYNDSEMLIEDLWKIFYKSISIKERKNEKARMNFMPKKYWKNIIEVKDEI